MVHAIFINVSFYLLLSHQLNPYRDKLPFVHIDHHYAVLMSQKLIIKKKNYIDPIPPLLNPLIQVGYIFLILINVYFARCNFICI